MPYLYHSFINPHIDSTDTTQTRPSDWNARLKYSNSGATGPGGSDALVREVLAANRTYYVRAGGANNSSHTGRTNTDADAFATFQYLYDTIIAPTLDFSGFTVTMQGDGSTLVGFILGVSTCNPWVGGGILVLDNVGGTLTSVDTVVTFGNYVPFIGILRIQNAIVTATGGSGFDVGVATFDVGFIEIGENVIFGNCTFAHRYLGPFGTIVARNPTSIQGDALASIFCSGGYYQQQVGEDIPSPITIGQAYAICDNAAGSTISFLGAFTNSGNVTGQKFFVGAACEISVTAGASELDFFPGTIAGMIMTAGRYNDWPLSNGHTVTAGDVVVKPAELITVIEKTVGAATQVEMPADTRPYGSIAYIQYLIKDGKGDAAANNITVIPPSSGTIDGSSNYVIAQNYGYVSVFLHPIGSTRWHTVNRSS